MSLLTVLPFHVGDLANAEALAELIADIGGVSEFDALIVTPRETPFAKVHRSLASAFRSVEVLLLDNIRPGWPSGPNQTFSRTAQHLSGRNVPFLFLEADCAPTRPSWLKELSDAYKAHGKPFMGMVRETVTIHTGKRVPDGMHMVGAGIYPKDLMQYSDLIGHIATVNSPFDYVLQGEIVYGAGAASMRPWGTGCYDTPLMSHHWATRNWRVEDGALKCDQDNPDAICDPLDLRTPALAHGCKDLSLLNLVRSQLNDRGSVLNVSFPSSIGKTESPLTDELTQAFNVEKQAALKEAVALNTREKAGITFAQHLEGKTIVHGTPVNAEVLSRAVRENKLTEIEQTQSPITKFDGSIVIPSSNTQAQRILDIELDGVESVEPGGYRPELEPVESLVAPEVVTGEQAEEIHVSEQPVSEETILYAEIREKSDNGIKFHTLMKDYKLTSKKLKAILNAV